MFVTIELKEKLTIERIMKLMETLKENHYVIKQYDFNSECEEGNFISFEGDEIENGKEIILVGNLYKAYGMTVDDAFGMYKYLELDK